ncbi:MAG TPA: T9SS type A sorting domain-containing protein [Bacteroidales bacterium]|nr:T9SS type A sorting domain-containing protein [Bacteroidales bacterium]
MSVHSINSITYLPSTGKIIISLFFSLTIYSLSAIAQTGPGGVGNVSTNLLWLSADKLSYSDGNTVTVWTDLSGNGNHANYTGTPLFKENAINGKPAVSFSGDDCYADIFTVPHQNMAIYAVFQIPSASAGPVWQNANQTVSGFFPSYSGTQYLDYGGAWLSKATTFTYSVWYISEVLYLTSYTGLWKNGVSNHSTNSNAITKGGFRLGNRTSSGYFKGDIAEIIFYDMSFNSVQRKMVENYLSSKYNISIANDYYAHDTDYGCDVAGIGRDDASNIHSNAVSAGIFGISNPDALDNADFILFGHNDADVEWTSVGAPSGREILSIQWQIDKTNDAGKVDVYFYMDSLTLNSDEYYLLTDADGDFTSGAVETAISFGGYNYLKLSEFDLTDDYYYTLAQVSCTGNPGTVSISEDTDTIFHNESVVIYATGYEGSLQWQISVQDSAFIEYTGATLPEFTSYALDSSYTYRFRVQVNDGCNTYSNYETVVFRNCASCAQIGGTGSLDTDCYVNSDITIPDGKYIWGQGNLHIQSGKTMTTSALSMCHIYMDGDVNVYGDIEGNVDIQCNNFLLDGNIDASGKGYPSASGPGAGYSRDVAGNFGAGGGSYAGNGGDGVYTTNSIVNYGSVHSPFSFGSGGGRNNGKLGGAGGGLIKINARNKCTLNGRLYAKGTVGTYDVSYIRASGGGSGGSIWINTSDLDGSGADISALGGDGGNPSGGYDGGGGGGGRIAIYYDTDNSTSFTYSAFGGVGNSAQTGGAGTIYLRDKSSYADLIINNNNLSNTPGLTPLDMNQTENVDFGTITVTNKAILEFFGNQTEDFSVNTLLQNINNGKIYFRSDVSSFTCTDVESEDSICVKKDSDLFVFNCNDFTTSGYFRFYCNTLQHNSTGDVTIADNGIIKPFGNKRTYSLECENLYVSGGSKGSGGGINLSANGYKNRNSTNTNDSGAGSGAYADHSTYNYGGGGGAYGGDGGDGNIAIPGGAEYGTASSPTEFGSGGGDSWDTPDRVGGYGGGSIKIIANETVSIEGIVCSDGAVSPSGAGNSSGAGGGAGGSIWIQATDLQGSGTISANGANGGLDSGGHRRGGGGSGGRIDVCFVGNDNFAGVISVTGGLGNYGGYENEGLGDLGTILRQQGASGSCDDVLPVSLKSFNANCSFPNILLTWSTVSEKNNSFFIIERSLDLKHWDEIGIVYGAGNSNVIKTYAYQDYIITDKVIYYCLKQVDFDGNYQYLQTEAVQCHSQKLFETGVYPNPFLDFINLTVNSDQFTSLSIEIQNVSGQEVFNSKFNVDKGFNSIQIDLSELTNGIYVMNVFNDIYYKTYKIFKN